MLAFLDAHFEEIFGAILLAAMVTIVFLNVIVRYCIFFFCLERGNDSEFLCLGNNAGHGLRIQGRQASGQ